MDPTSARVADPLGPVTRVNRKWLLFTSLLGVLLVQAGLVPTKLSLLGTEFEEWKHQNLVVVIMVVCIFYLLSFVISAVSDYYTLRMNILAADTQDDGEYEQLLLKEMSDALTAQDKIRLFRMRTHSWIYGSSGVVLGSRVFVEIIVPILFGLYSITAMCMFNYGV